MSDFDFDQIQKTVEAELERITSFQQLQVFQHKYLGRKGVIPSLTRQLSKLEPVQRRQLGQRINALKQRLINYIAEKEPLFKTQASSQSFSLSELSLPGIAQELGHLHPITRVIEEICGVFMRMGFSVVEGPEIETEYNNFTGLNIPLEHPARDVFDTFYLEPRAWIRDRKELKERLLLRSHTSPVQIRVMRARKPPLAVVVPGRVYRPDAVDASHSFMFHQIEGFMVDEDIRFSDLKGVLEVFLKAIFGQEISMRFRPHFFPFTEPSAEVDIGCIICKGEGCSVCSRKGWLEILGAGMIHPNVFKNVGYDPNKYTGFAFGLGVERIAMLKYSINDIRLFFENDLRFLKQF
ncbi:MAG: phenylalanine--tRNA ligase subunit alpha [Candidatus Omnitrophica bacterium]|nr:phenylalanine--tRNA ligase subunit alpha [Candidatus Omnitrophota bacterium]